MKPIIIFHQIFIYLVFIGYFPLNTCLRAQTLRLPDSILRFVYTAPDSLVPASISKTTFVYDDNLRIAETAFFNVNLQTQAWVLKTKTYTSYHATSQPICILQEIYDPAGPSFPSPYYLRDSLKYNAQGQLIRESRWQKVFNWAPSSDIAIYYWGNPVDSITSFGYWFGSGGPVLGSKTLETFAPGLRTKTFFRPDWLIETIDSVYFNPSGLLLAERTWRWDIPQQLFVRDKARIWAYNGDNSVEHLLEFLSNEDTLSKTTYAYDPISGQLRETLQKVYLNNAPAFEGIRKRFFYTTEIDSVREFSQGTLSGRTITYYSTHTIGIEPASRHPLFIMRNNGTVTPVCISQTPEPCTLRLLDTWGRVVWQSQLLAKASIPLPELPAGIYLLEGSVSAGIFCQKVLIP